MFKIFIVISSVLLFGFLIPDDRCTPTNMKKADMQNDGPYVLYKGDKVYIKYVVQKNNIKSVQTDSVAAAQKSKINLSVATDVPEKHFLVTLKKEIQNEKAVTPNVNKLLALSDIEGNFSAFRKLLQGNGVIDSAFNWIFGNGHLVLTGDFVDRGEQVTEVLWLIYSLEEKAKAAGGYVHFVLGNHEIMNLNLDLRYLNKKYLENTTLLNEGFETLYGEQSELGRWLRSKNIIENVGGILFLHGGISPFINNFDVSIEEINMLARPYYADTTDNYPRGIDSLFNSSGPFWYRGYYTGKRKATMQQIDSTLEKFKVNKISTGHTVVADTISAWFDGKVFNTDVHHAKGNSEALLMENDKFYRVNADGRKILLMNRK